ncbi:hypothetical protein NW762_010193 [Fusarium torreyae]|uniref:Uncharacterized protein n=1 Tax=Fusarium torreyae TaxID=1237075 RepID=A0A9W8VDM4_9HYPO|nr:hypothetical protein NW762_010193 [Fusarium torreyae]
MLARTAILSVFAALAATSFAAEIEPYTVTLYEDEDCQKSLSMVGSSDDIQCEDVENEFTVPIRSFKFEHPNINSQCGFTVGVSKDTNSCDSYIPYSYTGNCYGFRGSPGQLRPAIKSFFARKTPCFD